MKSRQARKAYIAISVGIVLCVAAAAQNSASFSTQRYAIPGAQALSVATGDFNRDGLPDLAVGIDSNVAIILATAPGSYGAQALAGTNASADQIVVGDVNGDGILDLVVRHRTAAWLTVLIGSGDGTFHPVNSVALEAPASAIVMADFNNDQKADVAVTECVPNAGCSLHAFLSMGDGTFVDTGGQNSTDEAQGGLVAMDFNRDGNLDLATTSTLPTRVLVYFGHGDGSFQATGFAVNNPIPANAAESLPDLAGGDFDGDGTPDIAMVAGYVCGSACGADRVHLLHSNGDGTFVEKSSFAAWSTGAGGHLLVSDLNGDLAQDLMYWNSAHFGGGNTAFFNNGLATFTQGTTNLNGSDISGFAARDLGHDSRHELIMTSWSDNGVVVAQNTSAARNCALPNTAGVIVQICQPLNGQIVASGTLFPVVAGGDSAAGVVRMELWVDGQKIDDVWNDQLKELISASGGQHQVAVVAVDRFGTFATQTVTVTAEAATTSCGESTPRVMNICQPANGATVSSPVHIVAAAYYSSNISVMQVYVDGVKAYQAAPQLDDSGNEVLVADIPMSAGTHRITVQALDSAGSFKATVYATVGTSSSGGGSTGGGGTGTCTAPTTTRTVVICSPASGATAASPVHITASAKAGSSAIKVMQVYVDGVKKYEQASVSSIDTSLSMTAGAHRVTVQAIDSAGGFKATENITVQ